MKWAGEASEDAQSFLRALGGTIKETNFRLGKDTGAKVLFQHVSEGLSCGGGN